MTKATSINIKPASWRISESHNERRGKIEHIIPGREDQHEHWSAITISSRLKQIAELYQREVEQRLQASASPIREGVVVIQQETTMQELQTLGRAFKKRFGIDCFQIHIHKDEGRKVKKNEVRAAKALADKTLIEGELILNLHAHMIFDWQDKRTGRSIKLNRADMREMQTITAQTLGMARGQENSRAVRLEVNEFKAFRERLNENVSNELDRMEEAKKQALEGLKQIENQKKNSLNELRILEAELDELESKLVLTEKLQALQWSSCTINNVQWWLSLQGFVDIRIRSGQDGSIYFKHGEQIARLKDLTAEVQSIIKQKLSEDKIFQNQRESNGKSKGQRL